MELQQLQAWINDSPACCAAHIRRVRFVQLTSTLLDELVRVLRLDFAYIRVSDSLEGLATEFARAARRRDVEPREIGQRSTGPSRTKHLPQVCCANPNRRGRGLACGVGLGLAVNSAVRCGLAATDFPTQSERLVLRSQRTRPRSRCKKPDMSSSTAAAPNERNSARRFSTNPTENDSAG